MTIVMIEKKHCIFFFFLWELKEYHNVTFLVGCSLKALLEELEI